jgi:hypothetical protein
MAAWLKQSTSVTIQLGPFVDKTDGVTYETGLATAMDNATTGIRLSKNGAALADRSDATAPTYDAFGFYRVVLDATDTGTLGNLIVQYGDATTCLPVWKEYMVVPANVWDSMFGADLLQVDVTQIGGGTQSATDLKDFADDGYDPATNKVQGVVLVDTITTYTGNTVQTGDAFARIGLNGAGLTNIDLPDQTMNITGNITGNLSGSVGSVTGAVGSVTGAVGSVTGNVGGSVVGSVASVTAGVTVTTNNDKTGYSLTQTFPANFASLAISVGGLVDADVEAINGTEVIGAGTALDLWRA